LYNVLVRETQYTLTFCFSQL